MTLTKPFQISSFSLGLTLVHSPSLSTAWNPTYVCHPQLSCLASVILHVHCLNQWVPKAQAHRHNPHTPSIAQKPNWHASSSRSSYFSRSHPVFTYHGIAIFSFPWIHIQHGIFEKLPYRLLICELKSTNHEKQ